MTQGTFSISGSAVEDQERRMSVISGHRIGETIHSGHFMVSDFEPESEAQDEEYEVGMPIPPGPEEVTAVALAPEPPPPVVTMRPLLLPHPQQQNQTMHQMQMQPLQPQQQLMTLSSATAVSIDGSLTKLFQCMSLAYRQKLTSPKWNRFKGVRLRWKDKIRLNNVIWRCWHMQFIMKKKTLVCQFASPLDSDTHNKPEAVVMEGKYWKRKLSTVAAEYKKWRLFYRNRIMGWTHNAPTPDLHPVSLDGFDWSRSGTFGGISNMIFDDDLLMDFTDTLFSSLSSQPFAFPNPREIARAGMVADFIQPGLVQLQPNLEDFMDTLEPLHDYVNSKLLPPVPEELDNFEPPDSLLSEDVLPSMGSKGADKGRSSSLPSMEGFGQSFYQMNSMNGGTRGESSNTVLTPAKPSNPPILLKESPRSSSRGGYASRNDLFAKPVGKPRGRSRSGGGRGQTLNSPSTPSVGGGSGGHQGSMILPVQQMSNASMVNSNTLLSHLLTNSGGNGSQYGVDKMGAQMMSNMGPLNMIMSEIPQHSHHQQQHQQQQQQQQPQQQQQLHPQQHQQQLSPPWTPKSSISEGIHPNIPINFGMGKGILLPPLVMGSSSKGGGSPPLLHGSPSPPMGPPLSGPSSPSKPFRPKSDTERVQYKEHRRVSHINAEQKRRCNIKNGFDTLHSLIPQLSHNPNAKVSKAAMLQKGAEYIRQLKLERAQLKEEIEAHRQEVETLNSAINNCQSMLPATGAPVSRQRTNKMKEMFEQWIRIRTNENWKFWIFSCLIRPLLDSYNNSVSTASVDELCRTVLAWVDQHCSLVDLRPVVLNSLRYLCTTTDILSNPANLPDEAYKAVNRGPHDRDTKGDQR